MFCIRGGCGKTTNGRFCEAHTCSYVSGNKCDSCSRWNMHCKIYKCVAAGCDDIKDCDSVHCFRHRCWYRDAGHRFCVNIAARGICKEHICNGLGCIRIKLCESDWCGQHKCKRSECKGFAEVGSRYCLLHKCLFGGCSLKRINGNYCVTHTPLILFFTS